jgi:hypothetical protein
LVLSINPAAPAAEAGEAQSTTQTEAAPKNDGKGPAVQVPQAEAPPVIDGGLDDACWTKASAYSDFYCPDWDGAPPEKTTVYITADQEALYVGVRCEDRTPGDIVANETRRNGAIWQEDHVEVMVDPTHQHKDYYTFVVSARGTQAENIPGGSATKIEWRGDWPAAACRTDFGWTAELAIPYSLLPCAPGQDVIGLAVVREYAKERVVGVWPNVGKTYDYNLSADLFIKRPVVEASRVVWMPYLTADVGDATDRGADVGLDVQYRMPNGLTALGSANPDFKQIEDVVEPIAFSYTERYLPDPRPFFVTGQDGYLPDGSLLYTRRIEDFDVGVKLFGTRGKETIGFLDTVRLGDENSLAMSWGHKLDDDNNMTLSLVSHHLAGQPGNLAFALARDHTRRQPSGGGSDFIWAELLATRDDEMGGGTSLGVGGSHDRGPSNIAYNWKVRRVTSGFYPALGYSPEVNKLGGDLNFSQTWIYEKGPLMARQWVLETEYFPYLQGDGVLSSRLAPGYAWVTRGNQLWVITLERARYAGFDSSDVVLTHTCRENDPYHRTEMSLLRGKRAGGDYTYLNLGQRLKPMSNVCLTVDGEWSRLETPDEDSTDYQAVLTASYDLTPEKTIAARVVAGNNGTNIYAAYRQVVRKGMDAYMILGDPDPERTGFVKRLVVKLIWAF